MSEKPLYAADDFAAIAASLRHNEEQRQMDRYEIDTANVPTLMLQCENKSCTHRWERKQNDPRKIQCRQCGCREARIAYHMPVGGTEWLKGAPP